MTDAELATQAGLEFGKTTITYKAWVKQGKPAGHWRNGFALLQQIGTIPPPPTGVVVAPPQGKLALHDGLKQTDSYEFLYQPQALAGGDIGGLALSNYLGYGLGIMSWNPQGKNATPFTIHDLTAQNIAAVPPGSKGGTAEAGIWLAQLGQLARIVLGPGNAWMDLWTGGLGQGGYYRDMLFQHPEHVAAYHEHVTQNLLMEYFKILQGTDGQSNPINVEWTYGGVGSSQITWRAFEIYCPKGQTGIFVDAGTWGCTIGDPSPTAPMCVFTGPGNAIGLPNNLAGPTQNVVNLGNIKFLNAGQKVYYHDNAIGAVGVRRLVQRGRRLHPQTERMPTPVDHRLELIAERSAA